MSAILSGRQRFDVYLLPLLACGQGEAENGGGIEAEAASGDCGDVGRSWTVTGDQDQSTVITYHALARKTSLSDPDTGLWQYAYDNAGNLLSQTDARGIATTFTYDALNRLTSKRYRRLWSGGNPCQVVSLADLQELRTAVNFARVLAGQPRATWLADPVLSTSNTIRDDHFSELKAALDPLTGPKSFSAGPLVAGRTISARDLADLRECSTGNRTSARLGCTRWERAGMTQRLDSGFSRIAVCRARPTHRA